MTGTGVKLSQSFTVEGVEDESATLSFDASSLSENYKKYYVTNQSPKDLSLELN